MMNPEEHNKEDGTVWSSYADLFTNVAVIFLVMFVFALLKAGLSQIQGAQTAKKHEAELNARLAPEALARSEQKIQHLQQSLQEMSKVQNLVDDKMKEIQGITRTLQANKEAITEVIREQSKKDALLNSAGERIQKKDREIQTLSQQSQEILKSLKTLEQENEQLSRKIEAGELAEENLKTAQSLLKKELKDTQSAKEKLERHLAEIRSRSQNDSTENQNLLNRLSRTEEERQALQGSLGKLNSELERRAQELEHFKSLYQKAVGQADSMQDRLNQSQGQLKQLASSLQEMRNKLRSGVAGSLKQKFQANQMNVNVDPSSGTITLQVGNHLLFKRNSHQLSEGAQQALSKIAPIYASVIFGDAYLASRIESIEVIGHASPSFKQAYTDPARDLPDAYAHNMRLSAQRAASITNHLVGRTIGKYRFKDQMKLHLSAIGKSYIAPISAKEEPAAGPARQLASIGESKNCGPYDCELSQRVEISFRLKEDLKALEKLIDATGGKK
jgi:outer membrane protein OmpA-like peptidoglycan-associated protein